MAITHYHTQIEPIAKAYNEAITERSVKDALVKKYGSAILDQDSNAFREFTSKANEYRIEQLRIASGKVKEIQEKARLEVDSILKKHETTNVYLLSGAELIDQYAARHNLDKTTAEKKLRDYAELKTYGFDQNSIADQYACLVNGKETGYISLEDQMVLSKIHRDYGIRISQLKAEADNILSFVNADPHNLMAEVSGAGYAILKKLEKNWYIDGLQQNRV